MFARFMFFYKPGVTRSEWSKSDAVLATQAGVVPNSRVIGVDAGVSSPVKEDVAAIGGLGS